MWRLNEAKRQEKQKADVIEKAALQGGIAGGGTGLLFGAVGSWWFALTLIKGIGATFTTGGIGLFAGYHRGKSIATAEYEKTKKAQSQPLPSPGQG